MTITKKKQELFLRAYQEHFDIGKACQIAGLDYADFKELMASNAVFKEVFEEIDEREVDRFMSLLLTKPTEKEGENLILIPDKKHKKSC